MVKQDYYFVSDNLWETKAPEEELEILKHRIHMATCYLRSISLPISKTATDRAIEKAIHYLDYDNPKYHKS